MRQAPAPMVLDATPALERQLRNSNRWKEASIPLLGFGQHQGHYIAAVHADASQQAVNELEDSSTARRSTVFLLH